MSDATGERRNWRFYQGFRGLRTCRSDPSGESGLRQVHQQTKEASEAAYIQAQAKRQQQAPRIGRVLLLYVDEAVGDAMPFGDVRRRAFAIPPREALLSAGKRLCERPVSRLGLRWRAIDRAAARFKH